MFECACGIWLKWIYVIYILSNHIYHRLVKQWNIQNNFFSKLLEFNITFVRIFEYTSPSISISSWF